MQMRSRLSRACLATLFMAGSTTAVRADVITQWNTRANDIIVESKIGTPPAIRVMALVQTAVAAAVAEVDRSGAGGISMDAAVAAANRSVLARALPAQQASIQSAYQAALAGIADTAARDAGNSLGGRAAAAVLGARADDGAATPETYRPHTTPGAYVPTALPAVPQWPQRKPWLLSGASQFRPGPPPSTSSELWARDYNEVKAYGGRASARRSAEQSEIARFWEYSLPSIYHGVVQSVANTPGRDLRDNARLFAIVSQAMDDALISVFDAKYHYNFWRPLTAIRNGDVDGNEATERDAAWSPFIETPAHPEYPCAHCILASTVATVLQAEIGNRPMPLLATSSPSAKGATRRWTSVEALVQEVASARIYDGVHYRNSTEVGVAMGRRIGELAAARLRAMTD